MERRNFLASLGLIGIAPKTLTKISYTPDRVLSRLEENLELMKLSEEELQECIGIGITSIGKLLYPGMHCEILKSPTKITYNLRTDQVESTEEFDLYAAMLKLPSGLVIERNLSTTHDIELGDLVNLKFTFNMTG